MRVLLIMTDAHMHTLRIGSWRRSMREAPLTLTTLAALTPPDMQVAYTLVDESIDPVPLDAEVDLVGISALTGTAPRAYELAAHFRRRGVPVVLGGAHVTILPEEAAGHADSIVVGRGEGVWQQVLRDAQAGRLQPRYDELPLREGMLEGVPIPRRDLQRWSGYMMPNTVHATRGCTHTCDFCSVGSIFPGYFKRPIGDVVADVKSIRSKLFTFNDVSLLDDRPYAMELLAALVPLKKRWGGLATTTITQDPELMAMLQRAGCAYLLLGFETIEQQGLNKIYKGFNRAQDYATVMEVMHAHGISVQGTFVFGMDHDDPDVFARTVELVNELKVDIPRYSIYTPYPGTRLFNRLYNEGRILSFNWDDYDTMHVVIQPQKLTVDELYAGFKWAYRETFKLQHIVRRTRGLNLSFPINFVGNMAYQIFVHRLYHDERFARPYSEHQPPFDPGRFAKLAGCKVRAPQGA